MSLTETVLDDHIENRLADSVVAVNEVSVQIHCRLSRLIHNDAAWLALIDSLSVDSVCNLLHCEDHLTRGSVGTQDLEHVPILRLEDVVNARGVEDLIWDDSERVLVHNLIVSHVDDEVVGAKGHRLASSSNSAASTAPTTGTTSTTTTAAAATASAVVATTAVTLARASGCRLDWTL